MNRVRGGVSVIQQDSGNSDNYGFYSAANGPPSKESEISSGKLAEGRSSEIQVRNRLVLLSILFFFMSCSARPNLLLRVIEYQDHKNQQDLEFVLAMFAKDATLDFGPMGSLTGTEQIRAIHEYDVALNTIIRFEDCEAIDNRVSCRTTETNDWLSLAYIESITYEESRFVFTPDGRIQSASATLSPESGAALGAAIAHFDTWAKANRPDEYAALFSQDGRFAYSYENGKRVLDLLRQWHPD